MTRLELKRGGTLRFALECLAGDPAGATVRCVLKAANRNGLPPGDGAAEVAVLDAEWAAHLDPADLDSLPGWIFTLEATSALTVSRYFSDVLITLADGSPWPTEDTLQIDVVERITEPAA